MNILDRVRFLTAPEISGVARERGIYARDGRTLQLTAEDIKRTLSAKSSSEIERRINSLVVDLKMGQEREAALSDSVRLATTSKDPFDLHYMAGMYRHHREVLRALAKNPNLSENTQRVLYTQASRDGDREVLLGLAHNPVLAAGMMEQMLNKVDDPFVRQGLAQNAARQARQIEGDSPFAQMCAQLSMFNDDVLAKTAIAGVKSPEVLREIVNTHSLLLAPDKLEAVAQNPNTPDDVLQRLAQTRFPSLQPMLGIQVASRAREALSSRELDRQDLSPQLERH